MEIFVIFPDGLEKKFENARQASKEIQLSPRTVLNALKTGKETLIRKKDKAEFMISCRTFPKIVISDGEEEFSFSSLKEIKKFFELLQILSSFTRRKSNLMVDKKKIRLLRIKHYKGKLIPFKDENGYFQKAHNTGSKKNE